LRSREQIIEALALASLNIVAIRETHGSHAVPKTLGDYQGTLLWVLGQNNPALTAILETIKANTPPDAIADAIRAASEYDVE
jgi:hypothetical protein